jgi:hypothetical protein
LQNGKIDLSQHGSLKEQHMPKYDFRHKETGDIKELSMRISEKEEWLKANPDYESVILGAPSLGDPWRLGMKKPDQGFREVLQKAQAAHPKGKINTF